MHTENICRERLIEMTWKKKAKAGALGLGMALALGMLMPNNAFAEIRTIEAEGIYLVGDGMEENPATAKARARDEAKRVASEKASVYVESLSEVRDGSVTEDIIRTISANVLQIKEEKPPTIEVVDGGALLFRCQIVALVDSDKVIAGLHQDRQELDEATRRNKELEALVAKQNAELETLKKQYAGAQTEQQKAEIRVQVKINEQKFEAREWLERGAALMNQKDFRGAVDAFRKAIDMDPNDAIAYYRAANAYRMLKEYDNAVGNYRKAIELDSRYSDAYNNLGFTFEQMGSYGKAAENYQRAIQCDPNYAAAYYNMGNNYFRNGDYQQAVRSYEQVVRIDNRYILAYNNLGLSYENMGAYDKSIASFTQAIDMAPDKASKGLARTYNNRGTCYQKMHRFDEALADYAKAMELDPGYAEPRTNRDQLLKWMGR